MKLLAEGEHSLLLKLGGRIKHYERARPTADDLAVRLDMSRGHLSEIERSPLPQLGATRPASLALAALLQLPPSHGSFDYAPPISRAAP